MLWPNKTWQRGLLTHTCRYFLCCFFWLTHRQQISLLHLSCCCLDFWRDNVSAVNVTILCFLSDAESAFASMFLKLSSNFCWYSHVCMYLMDLCALQPCSGEKLQLWIVLTLIWPLMTPVWVHLWFIQKSNVSWEAEGHMTQPPPPLQREAVLCLLRTETFRKCHASSLVLCCSKELRRMKDWV